jgi:group I intron endonuclease
MIGIYKITSPSNKIYIGQSINIEKRKNQYKILDKNCIGPKLYNSLSKYGWEQHNHEIIEECNLIQLNEQEIYWKQYYINLYGWSKMLFCELYDMGGGPKSEETKQKQSISQKKNLARPEIKEKRKINCKIAANIPGVQEKAVANTDWVSRNKKLKKPIIQLDLNDKFVKEWDSAKQIQLSNKGMWATDITRCCKGHQKTAYGFIWVYKTEYLLSNSN